jgi:hypothetical protein
MILVNRKNKCVSDVTERVMASDLLSRYFPMGMTSGGPITVTVK